MDALKGAGDRETAEADRLGTTATAAGSSALSGTVLAAAKAAVLAVQGDDGGGAIGEPVADLRRLRTDPVLMAALTKDLAIAQRLAELLIEDALWLGYRTAAVGRAAIMATDHMTITVDTSDAERAALADYPMLGHTAAEVASNMVLRLRYEVDGALAAPLTGTIDASAVPASLGLIAQAHGARLGDAVRQAHATGVQAAVRAIGAALVGVV